MLVRRTTGNTHQATDHLDGTQEPYGTESTDPASGGTFSVRFEEAVPSWNEFLFATGDCEHWMVMSKQAAIGGWFSNELRDVERSHSSATKYQIREYRRQGNSEDPWIQYEVDHSQATALYMAGSYNANGGNGEGAAHNGLNVYVRKGVQNTNQVLTWHPELAWCRHPWPTWLQCSLCA